MPKLSTKLKPSTTAALLLLADGLARLPEVKARTGLARSTIYLKIQQGEFPKPRKIGQRAIAWDRKELSAWVASRPTVGQQEG